MLWMDESCFRICTRMCAPVCLCIIASAFTPLGSAESISGAHWWIMRLLPPQPTTERRLLVQHSRTGGWGFSFHGILLPAAGTRAFHAALHWTGSAENFCLWVFKNCTVQHPLKFTDFFYCNSDLHEWTMMDLDDDHLFLFSVLHKKILRFSLGRFTEEWSLIGLREKTSGSPDWSSRRIKNSAVTCPFWTDPR